MVRRHQCQNSLLWIGGITCFIFLNHWLITPFITSHLPVLCNPGIATGFLIPQWGIHILSSLIILTLIGALLWNISRVKPLALLGWSLILSGGVLNLWDRMLFGCVRDFLPLGIATLHNNPADWYIGLGTLILVIYYSQTHS